MGKYISALAVLALLSACTNPKKDASTMKAVDLGLSVKWASCNLGASAPEEYGDYYAWGEVNTKENYSWSTYRFGKCESGPFSKYITKDFYGAIDNKTILDPEDDVARIKLGGNWRMPTLAEQKELINNCTWEWTQVNGVNGYKITCSNGNNIFLPAAGYHYKTDLRLAGFSGDYWSLGLATDSPDYALGMYLVPDKVDWCYLDRYDGHSVRPVCEL